MVALPSSSPSPPGKTVLAFGPGYWPVGWVAGSPRYHLYGLAGAGYRVVYVEPPQGRLRNRAALKGKKAAAPGTLEWWPDRPLGIYRPKTRLFFHPRIPIPMRWLPPFNRWALERLAREVAEALPRSGAGEFLEPDLLWLGAYSHAPLLDRIPHRRSACFIYDDLPASPAWGARRGRMVGEMERELLRGVDLAIFTSEVLLESRRGSCRRALLLENAAGEMFFDESLPPRPRAGEGSGVLEKVEALARPRIGYVGALNLRLDLGICDTLARAAAARAWQVVFAGGIDWLYARGIGRLQSRVNVLFPGAVPPEEVPHLLRLFDVLVLPHGVNGFTRAMFPEKLPEYLASGRPIVSTRLPEVVRVTRGHPEAVRLADTGDGFVEACARSLEKEDRALSEARIALARRHTRARRLEVLREALEQLFA